MKSGTTLAALALAVLATASAGEDAKPKGLTAALAKKKVTRRFRGRERTIDALILTVKNEGAKTVLLPAPLAVKLHAKDAEGKAVPERKDPRAGEKKADEKKGTNITVLKTGQSLEVNCRTWTLTFPAKGKYTLWATVEAEPSEKEVLPGLKLWSGKLTSNEVEWEVTRVRGARRPRGGEKPKKPAEPKKDPKKADPKTEDF